MKEYYASREKETRIFGDSNSLVEVGERIAALEQRQSKLAKSGLSLESKEWSDEDAKTKERVNIEKLYVYQLMNATTPGILKDSKKGMATALIACLTMALGGGFALVAP